MSSNENNTNWRFENKKDSNQNNVPDWRFYNKPFDAHTWLRPYIRLEIMWSKNKTKMN